MSPDDHSPPPERTHRPKGTWDKRQKKRQGQPETIHRTKHNSKNAETEETTINIIIRAKIPTGYIHNKRNHTSFF